MDFDGDSEFVKMFAPLDILDIYGHLMDFNGF
jgi:hypothetical protein